MLKRKAEWNYKRHLLPGKRWNASCDLIRPTTISKQRLGKPPFAAEAIFGSHNEQYFLIKKAKVADIDTNETVYFATEESLSKDRLLELDSIAWERVTANVQPSSNHRNSDVVLIILTGHAEEDALTQVKKCKHYQSYLWGFHGWSNYRLIVAELSSGRIVHNRHGQILKKLVKKAIQ